MSAISRKVKGSISPKVRDAARANNGGARVVNISRLIKAADAAVAERVRELRS